MKWKTAKHGDIRVKTIFPIIPRNIQGVSYWLESIAVEQHYSFNVGIGQWKDYRVTKSGQNRNE